MKTNIRVSTLAMVAWMTLAVATVLVALAFQSSGGRWFVVDTPSMGRAAPVGTLVLTRPTTIDDLAVGDIISFHPPAAPVEVYTHRVVAITAAGVTTRGDINGVSDPWTLGDGDLIGKSIAVLPGAGWIIRCLPYLLVGGLVVWIITRFARSATRRSAMLVLGWSLVASLTVFIVRPLVGVVTLTSATTDRGVTATLVSTGLLPISVQAVGGTHVDLVSGQVGHITIPTPTETGVYALATRLDLGFWGWVILALVCALPLLWCVIVGLPADEPDDEDETVRVAHRQRSRILSPKAAG